MPVLTEPLMAQGEFLCDFSYDPALNLDLAAYRILQFFWGEELIFAGPILRRTVSRDQITVVGRSPLWYLGDPSNRGPLIDDREYIAGTNKLSNGDFELGVDGGTTNPDGTVLTAPTAPYWQLNQNSNWVIVSGPGRLGGWCALVTTDPATGDDVIKSSETFDASPGQQYRLQMFANRTGGAIGHVRARVVFEGFFKPPQLLANGDFAGGSAGWASSDSTQAAVVNDPGNAHSGIYVLKMGTKRLSPMVNGGFETGDLTGWVLIGPGGGAGTPGSFTVTSAQHAEGGFSAVATGATGGSQKSLQADSNPATPGTVDPFPAAAGLYFLANETWRFTGLVRGGTGGDAPDSGSQAFFEILVLDAAFPANSTYVKVATGAGADPDLGQWHCGSVDYTVGDTKVGFVPICLIWNQTTGSWYFDSLKAERLTNNTSTVTGSPFTVTPERVYKWQAWIRTRNDFISGALRFSVTFNGADRPPVTVTSGPYQGTNDAWQLAAFEFVPPSGMTLVTPSIIATDVVGGVFNVDDMTIADEDGTTVVFDVVTPFTTVGGWAPYAVAATAPDGTQKVHCEVIAENDALGWAVDDVAFTRFTSAPATAAEVVADCLTNPVSGSRYLTVGDVVGDQAILYDTRVRNMTNKALLDHLSKSGLVLPQREYRANPDLTFDWGQAADLFADRADIVLTPGDFHLLADPAVEVSMEDRVGRLKFLGADRQVLNGLKVPLTANAYNVQPDAVDAYGQPLERALLAQDSSIDQLPVAASYAAYQASRNNQPAQAIQVQLADWRAWGRFDVGDWIYLYKPEAGLEDLARPETKLDDGRIVFPARKRVLSRTWHLGSGPFRVCVVDPANRAQPIDVTDAVRWERDTVAQLEVGDRLPEFAIDPEGGNADVQFLRYRASITR